MGKTKTPTKAPEEDAEGATEMSYDNKVKFCAIIAKPLADEKLCKKVRKCC